MEKQTKMVLLGYISFMSCWDEMCFMVVGLSLVKETNFVSQRETVAFFCLVRCK